MPRLTHPEDGMVFACPECEKAGDVYERSGGDRSNAQDDKRYRCLNCSTSFDETVEREAYTQGGRWKGPSSEAGRAALEADPDVIGGAR